MRKEPLLFVSPFPPLQTGIADLSALLAAEMRRHFDVTLLVEDRHKSSPEGFKVLGYRNDPVDWGQYPHKFYHIGNNPWYHRYIYESSLRYPGVVLLHEPVLYYLFVGCYQDEPDFYSRVYDAEGAYGVALIKRLVKKGADLLQFREPHLLPFNRELINSGNRFLTHSEYARRQVLARADRPVWVERINQAVPDLPNWTDADRLAARQRLGIPAAAVVLASFGFVAPTKQNDVICRAVNRLNADPAMKVHYIMVGAGSYVDELLNDFVRVTGYVSDVEYQDYLAACDLIFNLRYPSMGETSAAALRALRSGRPCVVTNDAWFAELPSDVAIKLEPDRPEIVEEVVYELIRVFQANRDAFDTIGEQAAAFTASEHNLASCARQITRCLLEHAPMESRARFRRAVRNTCHPDEVARQARLERGGCLPKQKPALPI